MYKKNLVKIQNDIVKNFINKLSVELEYYGINSECISIIFSNHAQITIASPEFKENGGFYKNLVIEFDLSDEDYTYVLIDMTKMPNDKKINNYWLSKLIPDLTHDEIDYLLDMIDELKGRITIKG